MTYDIHIFIYNIQRDRQIMRPMSKSIGLKLVSCFLRISYWKSKGLSPYQKRKEAANISLKCCAVTK